MESTSPPPPEKFIEERVALDDFRDYLRRHDLVVVKVERWLKKGHVLICRNGRGDGSD
jgi:hypothetical protein